MPKTASTIQQTTQKQQKTDFHWKMRLCQAPHCCYKSAPAYMSCVDNIPTVCAPQPLFSLLRVLVGFQLKHRPLFYWLPSHFHHYHFAIRISCGSHFSMSHPRGQSMVILYNNNLKNVRWNEGKSSKYCENKREPRLPLTIDQLIFIFYSICKTKKICFPPFQ